MSTFIVVLCHLYYSVTDLNQLIICFTKCNKQIQNFLKHKENPSLQIFMIWAKEFVDFLLKI